MCDSPVVDSTTLLAFCKFSLNYILSHNPVLKASQAISNQHKWSFKNSNTCFVSTVRKQVLERQEVNWRTLLTTVSIFLVCSKEAYSLLQDFINKLLKESFDKLEIDYLISCFLITRQCVLEGPHYFISYENWFQSHFGDISTSFANTSKTFSYFVKFLTSLVPYEPVYFLKAHLTRPPSIPSKCRPLFNDYVMLVKTRLQDLKENCDQVGIYSEADVLKDKTEEGNSKFSTQAEVDVNKALLLYETTGRIPSSVLEASLFHKTYFIGQFLPVLLSPRPFSDVPDIRTKFIEELKKLGKLPVSLYDKYQEECERETTRMLEGVIMDESFEEELNNPFDTMQKSINYFCKSFEDKNKPEELMLINQLSVAIQSVLKENESVESPQKVICLTEKIDEHSLYSKISLSLLEAFKHCINLMELKHDEWKSDWDILFVSMIGNFPVLHKPLFLHLWQKLTRHNDDDSEIYGLSHLLIRITERTDIFPQVSHDNLSDVTTLCNAIFTLLKLETHQLMLNNLKLSTVYLKQVSKIVNDENYLVLMPSSLVKKFQFIAVRLHPELRELIQNDISVDKTDIKFDDVIHLFHSDLILRALDETKLSLRDWVTFEAEVEPFQDNFNAYERCEYFHWCIYCIFLPKYTVQDVCSCIFSVITSKSGVPSFCQLLLILQELSLSLTLPENKELPWLLQEFKAITEVKSASSYVSISIQHQLTTYFRIVTLLPPYLFYSNKKEVINEYSLNTLKEIVQNILRPYFLEVYSFPQNLTSFLWKGIASLSYSSCNELLIEDLLNSTPVLISSLVIHWSTIGTVLLKMVSQDSFLVAFLDKVKEDISLNPMCENVFSGKSKKWIISLAFAKQLNSSLETVNIPLMNDFEILHVTLYFMIAKIATDILNNEAEDVYIRIHPATLEIMKYLLTAKDTFECLKPQNYKKTILKDILLPSTLHLFSSGCLLVCLHFWKCHTFQIIQDNNKCASLIIVMLANLNDFLKVTDYFYGTNSANDDENIRINDLHFVVKLTNDVKSIVSTLPSSVTKLIPKDVMYQYELDLAYK
ncbi:Fanconi anemia group A protein homolog isoform X2 [Centruroides vittatus]|uniref:Fanconi anemia group A protein homolog isoform X2 n=1 Tax=Centruroides vittatus TaxID=120091 RepID=UPI003510C2E2